MKRIVAFLFCALLLVNLPGITTAGGYLYVTDTGVPFAWDNTVPIPWNPDQGGLGIFNNTDAVNYVQTALDEWSALATTDLSFNNAGNLPIDIQNTTDFFTYYGVGDGLSPVVFDEDGTLFDALFGPGTGVLGFATAEFVTVSAPFQIVEAFQAYNGRWIDGNAGNGEFPLANFAAVITHEFGHALNLDHCQVNGQYLIGDGDDEGFALHGAPPVGSAMMMFPFLFGPPYDALSPLSDDEAWMSALYPSAAAANFATISGTVYRPDGVGLHQGANVIARNPADPFFDAVAVVSGYRYFPAFGIPGGPTPAALEGAYLIPGLTPGADYTVEMTQVNPNFTGGSGVGPVDPPVALGIEEFYNGANESNANPPDVPSDYTLVAAGSSAIDMIINGLIDPNEPNDSPANCTAIAYGDVGSGLIDPSGDMDWFCFTGGAGDLIAAELLAWRNGTGLDPTLTLVDSDGSTVLAFNDDTFSLDSQIVTCLPSAGTFYLVVQGYAGSSTGAYDLSLDYLGQGDTEPNNDAANAIPLGSACPASASGCISPAGDTDFYSFTVSGPVTLQFNMDTQNIFGTPDAYLRLYDTDGTTLLDSDDDGGPGYDSQITYSFPAAGTYYIATLTSPIFDPNGTGLYSITVGGPAIVTHGNNHDVDATAGGNSGWSDYAPSTLGFSDNAFDGHYGIYNGVYVDDGDDADLSGTCIGLYDPANSKDEVSASLGDETVPVVLSGGATGMEIDQFTYHNDFRANGDPANWTLVQTVVRNTTGSAQSVKWYKHVDFDVAGSFGDDEAGWDASRNLAYQYDGSGVHVGIVLLSGDLIGYQLNDYGASDAPNAGDGARADFMDGNTLGDLSTPGPDDKNVSLAADLGTLQPGESAVIWWAVVGGNGLADLQADADDALLCTPVYAELDLDAGKCPNEFKLWNNGNTFAAIVGTADFDVNDIDASTVRLEGVTPKDTHVLDMTAAGTGGCDCPEGAPNLDAIDDLRLKMLTKEMTHAVQPLTAGEVRTLTATGFMLDGRPLIATGCAEMVIDPDDNADEGAQGRKVRFAPSASFDEQRLGFSAEVRGPVTVKIYSVTGRLVHTLADNQDLEASRELVWNTENVPTGIYFYRIQLTDEVITKKVLLAR